MFFPKNSQFDQILDLFKDPAGGSEAQGGEDRPGVRPVRMILPPTRVTPSRVDCASKPKKKIEGLTARIR